MSGRLKNVSHLFTIIFVIWGLYRFIFRLPENIEELILKPLVWLLPTFYFVFKVEKRDLRSLGYTLTNFRKNITKGLALAVFFLVCGLSLSFLKNGSLAFSNISAGILWPAVLLSIVTAVIEETVFRGYILNRLAEILKNRLVANLISSVGFCLIYLPISVFVYHYNVAQLFIFLSLIFLTSFSSGIIFFWTGSVWSSVLVHFFWAWPMIIIR